MFKVGQKVVCVDDTDDNNLKPFYSDWLVEGRIYTIRGISAGKHINTKDIVVYLEEIRGAVSKLGVEYGFKAERFREISETELDERNQVIQNGVEEEVLV